MDSGTIIDFAIYIVWSILLIINMISNHKNRKSNDELINEIHKSNDLNDQILEAVKNYCDSTERKSTTQDNLMWKSIIILAKRIHNLEDNNYVK